MSRNHEGVKKVVIRPCSFTSSGGRDDRGKGICIPRSADLYDPWRAGVGLVWTRVVEEESNIRTVSWSHSVTSLEKKAGQAHKHCTREKLGICRMRRLSVSEA